jgi:hypothetical protein
MWPAVLLLFATTTPPTSIDRAFERLYNFDFAGAHAILDSHIRQHPTEPLPYAVRASALLFGELHRLRILESEFFSEDKRVVAKKKTAPDEATGKAFRAALQSAQWHSQNTLRAKANDADALFTMSLVSGLEADYMALIEKRQWQSLGLYEQSQSWSLKLLKAHPDYADAELTGGACEYLLGSMPFFLRWFIRMEGVEGQKANAARKLERVGASGRYLGPFARILLSIVHLREKQPERALALLRQLSSDYPQNPLFRTESDKLTQRLARR